MKTVLVTGGAGFIGSHTVDLLVARSYRVRILDCLERPTHAGVPDYLNPEAEFIRGDVRNVDDLARALQGVEAVIHLAATGGFTPDLAKYLQTNAVGTANVLELIERRHLPVQRIVVASSVGIYGEGAYRCPNCGPKAGTARPVAQLESRDWEPRCPTCGAALTSVATDEDKVPSPEKAYSVSKYAQERLVLGFGRDRGIPCCALRYFLTYGPRQSLSNPYTGVISIFTSRIANRLPPLVFEDGRQTRDFVGVEDVARATVLALEHPGAAGQVLNVGTGVASRIGDVARLVAELLGLPEVEPEVPGDYRPGEARHIVADISRIRALGFAPQVTLRQGLARYVAWLGERGPVAEYLSRALGDLRRSGVVRHAGGEEGASPADAPRRDDGSLTVIVPAYNEAGNLESLVRSVLNEVSTIVDDFEIVIVDDGSVDGTGMIADGLAAEDSRISVIHHPFNVGYGGAQKSGFKRAAKEWVMIVPADHQFDLRDLKKLLDARAAADIVGSFRLVRRDTPTRRLVSRLYNEYMQRAYQVPLRDLNWVKLFRRSILESIEIETPRWAVDAEIVIKAARLGSRIIEVPVGHNSRTWGQPTGVGLRNLGRTARELWRLRAVIRRMKTVTSASRVAAQRP